MTGTVGVLYAPGTNCHEETLYAIERAGGQAELVILKAVLDGQDSLLNYPALIVPGGFSWGDHLGAGRIEGIILNSRLREQLEAIAGRIPVLGICNGFQVLVETGLLPEVRPTIRQVALLQNESARFESRWTKVLFQDDGCIWTKGLGRRICRIPVAHGEGRLHNPASLDLNPACWYVDAAGQPTDNYPDSPNGSKIAGIRDSTGLILGMMPHPERACCDLQGSTDGLAIFKNLIHFLRSN